MRAVGRRAERPGPYSLELIAELLERLGRPQDAFRALHVAGTRGKGSTCALLSAALAAAGHRAGLTTSPDLVSITERIRIGERDCSEEQLRGWVGVVRDAATGLEPSYFEALMAAAFFAFAEEGCELAVVEVGLGGRLDASVLCRPVVTAITRLGLEHCDRLGDTIESIAFEKAGILKAGVPAVLSPNEAAAVAVVAARAAEVAAPLRLLTQEDLNASLPSGLRGAVQAGNAALAWAVLEELARLEPRWAVTRDQAAAGFLAVRWAGRFDERVSPSGLPLLVDVAHDPVSVRALLEALEETGAEPRALVFTCLVDKDLQALAALLAGAPSTRGAAIFVPEVDHPRARPAAEVVAALTGRGLRACSSESVDSALSAAEKQRGRVVAFGTFAVAGGVLRLLGERAQGNAATAN